MPDDFLTLAEVAGDLGIPKGTLERWLLRARVKNVVWRRDPRGWILVDRNSIGLLRAYRNSIRAQPS